MKSRKKLARLLAVLVASSMVLGSPNAVAFAEGNEISEESLSGEKTAAAPAEAKESAEQKEPVSEEISDEGTNTPVKKAEAEQTGAAVSNTEKAEAEPKKSGKSGPEKEEKPETVQAFLAALDKIMELQENDAEAEKVLAAVEEAKKLYGALSEEEKALEEVKAGYEALESFESVNPLEEVVQDGTEEHPWLVGSEYTLETAINKAYDTDSATYIRLTEDIDIKEKILYISDEIVLDLDGHTVRNKGVKNIFDIFEGKLTVKGSGGRIEDTTGSDWIFCVSYGELRLSGGTYVSASEKGGVIDSLKSSITVEEGTVVEGTKGIKASYDSNVIVNGEVRGTGENETLVAAVTIEHSSALTVGKTGQITAERNCKGIEICGGSTAEVCPGATISSEKSEAIYLDNKEGKLNITGGTITGENGIVVLNGTLNISGDNTGIIGNGTDLKVTDEDGHPTPSGAGVLIYKGFTNNISVTVEDAEITGRCAIYGVTEQECVDYSADINVNLQGGRFTSTEKTDVAGGESLKAAFNLNGIKGETSKVSLTLFGGSYFGGEDSEAYIKYYKQYCAADYDIEKEEGTGYYKVVNKTAKAEVTGGEKYSTLQEAIDAAKTGDTVTLLADTEENVMISKGQEITLDLNGKTLNGGTVEKRAALTNNGIVIITDSQTGGTIKREDDGTAGYYTVQNNYKMYIRGGTITNNSNHSNVLINYNSQGGGNFGGVEDVYMEISGGTISQASMSVLKNDPGCTMKITGDATVIERQSGNVGDWACNFYGTVIMDGGTITTSGIIPFMSHKNTDGTEYAGEFTVTGNARLNCFGVYLVNGSSGGKTKAAPKLTISGNAKIAAKQVYQIENNSGKLGVTDATVANIDIEGGTFSGGCGNDTTKSYIIPTMEMNNEDRVVPLTAETGVAEVGGKYYNSLQAAVTAAKNGDTVTLLKEAKLITTVNNKTAQYVAVQKKLTIDLNGHTASGGYLWAYGNNADVTIEDTSEGKTGKIQGTTYGIRVNGGDKAVVTVNSGTVTGKYGIVVQQKGTVAVNSGAVTGTDYGIYTQTGTVTVSGGVVSGENKTGIFAKNAAVDLSGGTVRGSVTAVDMQGGTINVSGNALVAGGSYGISLQNETIKNAATAATLNMTGGTVWAGAQAVCGNNLYSQGTMANISGGKIGTAVIEGETKECGTGIFWPMAGTLTISGAAEIEALVGIEAKMGTINISGGTITGTGEYKEYEPNNDGTVGSGYALAVSAQHYDNAGVEGVDPNLTVNITGGTLRSRNGAAIEMIEKQEKPEITATINIENGSFEGKEAAFKTHVAGGGAHDDNVRVGISNGEFKGKITVAGVQKFISGGIYDSDVDEYVVTGKQAVQEGSIWKINSVGGTSGGDSTSGNTSSGGSSSGRRSSSRDEILNAGGASPMLIPVPQQPAVQTPAAPTPAATQPAAAAPEPLPAEEPAQLEDESVPLAEARQEETKGREEPEKVINIGDEEVPMAAPSASWAFLNLILMLVTAAGAIATVIGSVRRKGEEAEETGSTVWMIGLIPAICSTAMFVLTEKIGGSIVIADRWTVAMLLIALVEGAVVFFVYRMMNKAHNRA